MNLSTFYILTLNLLCASDENMIENAQSYAANMPLSENYNQIHSFYDAYPTNKSYYRHEDINIQQIVAPYRDIYGDIFENNIVYNNLYAHEQEKSSGNIQSIKECYNLDPSFSNESISHSTANLVNNPVYTYEHFHDNNLAATNSLNKNEFETVFTTSVIPPYEGFKMEKPRQILIIFIIIPRKKTSTLAILIII